MCVELPRKNRGNKMRGRRAVRRKKRGRCQNGVRRINCGIPPQFHAARHNSVVNGSIPEIRGESSCYMIKNLVALGHIP